MALELSFSRGNGPSCFTLSTNPDLLICLLFSSDSLEIYSAEMIQPVFQLLLVPPEPDLGRLGQAPHEGSDGVTLGQAGDQTAQHCEALSVNV